MTFFIIQCLYFYLFDMFLRKRDFRWSWFIPLAMASALASGLTFQGLTLDPMPGHDWKETWVYKAFILFGLLVVYPLQTVLIRKAQKLFVVNPKTPVFKAAVQRACLYLITLMITSWVFIIILVLLVAFIKAACYGWSHFFVG